MNGVPGPINQVMSDPGDMVTGRAMNVLVTSQCL